VVGERKVSTVVLISTSATKKADDVVEEEDLI
jgi:hypothetical protein